MFKVGRKGVEIRFGKRRLLLKWWYGITLWLAAWAVKIFLGYTVLKMLGLVS